MAVVREKVRIILASASPRRKELLAQIGITPEIVPSSLEEKVTSRDPKMVVEELSAQKAEDVASRFEEGTLILGADTVVAIDGQILLKPADAKQAFFMLRLLAGKRHQVYTGVTMIWKGKEGAKQLTFSEKTEVSVYPMEEGEIRSYIESGEAFDKAGAYGIQGSFAAFIQGIDGDYTNVVGLPVGRVYQEIKGLLGREGSFND